MKIPVAKPYLTEEEAKAAYDTILSGWVTQGPKVQEFEERFAEYAGSKYAVATSSCTTALHLILIAAGLKKDDEVICPSMSFIATANSIVHAGAKPIFAEVNPYTYNLDIEDVKRRISNKTRAILLVHQIGIPADIEAFSDFCRKNNLRLIEDAACAAGSEYKNKKIGSHSELVCFSFHPRKLISTGDGGMITTSNEEYYKRLKHLRQHGMSVSDLVRHSSSKIIAEEYLEVGYNYRMTDIQASVGIKQLEKLDWIIKERKEIAQKYNDAFRNIDFVRLPVIDKDNSWNYQSYIIYLKDNSPLSRDEMMQKMLDLGISTRRGIMNAHIEKAYTDIYGKISLPLSEDLSERSIILPLFVPMTEEEINFIIKSVRDILF